MRVRYQIAGEETRVICDMSDKKAKKLFKNLKTDTLCKWAELVGEEDENYMQIIDSFDNNEAQKIKDLFGDFVKSKYQGKIAK